MFKTPLSRWLLPVSLSANVFLAVLLLMGPPAPPPGPPHPRAFAEKMAENLPPADAAILRKAFADRAAELDRADQVVRGAPERVLAALAAPEFKPEALKEAFENTRQLRVAHEDVFAAAMIEAASRMSPEGRRKLADWRPPRPPERRP